MMDKYKLQIKIIVYLSKNRSKFDIWELDVFCGTEHCSRPTIFQQVRTLLSIDTSHLTSFPLIRPSTLRPEPTITTSKGEEGKPITTAPVNNYLKCYKCLCDNITCPCMTEEENWPNNYSLYHCSIIFRPQSTD